MGSHPCHFYVQAISSFKGENNGLWKEMCYGTSATSTLIIFRNVEIFKIIKIRRKKNCEEIVLEYPGSFHILSMKISKQNNYSTLKC